LKEHNIGDELMTRLSNIANDKYDKKIKIGLFRDYELLDALGDALGEKFSSDKKVQQLLTRRNSSILAHGIEPMDRESTKGLQSKVMEYAYALDEKNIRRLCDLAKFPEFRFQ